ncbi:hypothetical protein chiPu_0032042, partial [Chiloscyllium punctatum]|nr:hypothetical protein [Chiloscyllium punctatum]
VLRLGRAVLLGPAIDLPRKIVAGLAEIAEADLFRIEDVQLRQRLDLAGEDFPPRVRLLARQGRIPEHPPLLHRHDVEGRADHRIVGAQRIGFRDREILLAERRNHAELSIDRMGRRQQLTKRTAAHHVVAAGGFELVRRVGLAALELQDLERALIALDVLLHPGIEARLVDAMALLDFPCSGKFFVFPDAVRHDDAPSTR